jgi:hydrogenase nickel incorporation protein HypA/HybF
MHELSITESILEITLRHARQAGAKKITDLYLVIGQLSSVVDDSVQFYWDFVSQDSEAAGSKLHFRRMPAELECQGCGHAYIYDGENLACPQCGSPQVKIVSGDQFFLESISVEEPAHDQDGSGS